MSNWSTESLKSEFDSNSFIKKNMHDFDRTFTETDYNFFEGRASNYDVVGINANKVDDMRQAIRDYVKNIENYLDNIDPLENADGAFKSEEVQDAVSEYLKSLKEYCKNFTSGLLAFSDQIGAFKYQWLESTKRMASTITSDRNSINDISEHYTERIQ